MYLYININDSTWRKRRASDVVAVIQEFLSGAGGGLKISISFVKNHKEINFIY